MTATSEALFGDGHVHIYDAFDEQRLLDAAQSRARQLGGPLLLLLSESRGYRAFERLQRLLHATDEPASLRLRGEEGAPPVYVIAGRQVVSSERTEVLGLGLDPSLPESSLEDRVSSTGALAERFLSAGAVAVLPWGVGKWLGARARHVQDVISSPALRSHPHFFAGDIEHRFHPWPAPSAFEKVRVLPGTDLLPLPGIERRVAAYGFKVFGRLTPGRPLESLLSALEANAPIESFGHRAPLRRVIAEQVEYRYRKARGRAL